jgi:Glycosyltransferases involved in cell wall biogenesis
VKLISIVTPCYNEEENVYNLYKKVKEIFNDLKDYNYEHIFIDNCSKDKTVSILTDIAKQDRNVKVIVNSRNFGHIRSPFYGLLQASGDAVISMAADFQEPPSLIYEFIKNWELGNKIVVGVKKKSKENGLMFFIRKSYYRLVRNISEVELIDNFTGFGLYDKRIIDILREVKDPYPYFRGLICEVGFSRAEVEFTQPKRERGITKNNFYTLYDMAMLGITNNSKVPLRLATMVGFGLAIISLIIALVYFILKLVFWNTFSLGLAPLVIGLFFFSSVQLFFIGVIGEYVASINTKVTNRPLVIEEKRINFEEEKCLEEVR